MVFGLFSKDRSLKRAVDVMTSVFRQSADRYQAMEKLSKDGSDESLFLLCKRFSVNADKTIEDQQEKQWVVDALAEKGAAALPPLRRYMKNASGLGYPLVALGRIADPPTVLEVVDEFLASEEPGYTREPKRKMDVLEWLGEWRGVADGEIARRVAPYLADFDEGVRFTAVETIAQRPDAVAGPSLARALVRPEEESKRLKLRIAEVLATHGFSLGEHAAAVAPILAGALQGYVLQGDVLVKA